MTWESRLIALLSASLLRPLALAAAAFLILRIFRVRHPASRHAVWTAVLVGILILPFASVLAPHWNLPLLPALREAAEAAPVQAIAPLTVAPAAPAPVSSIAIDPRPAARAFRMPSIQTMMLSVYLLGLFAMLAYRALGWVLVRRVLWRSKALRARLRESSDVVVPVAVGLLRPSVILPSGWRGWNPAMRRAVLAHEFAHLRRGDASVSALTRLVKCVFWFHPLAWLVSRKVAELAELACDAAALQRLGDPAGYSRVLLQFAGGVNVAGYRAALPGLAMADSSGLGQRIEQVFELSTSNPRRLGRPAAVLALIGVPAMCLAATVGLGHAQPRTQPAPAPTAPVRLMAQAQVEPPAPQLAAPAKPATSGAAPQFEKASLTVAGPPVSGELCWGGCGGPGSPYPESQNEITYRHFTLRKLLQWAYDLKDFQISGSGSLEIAYDVSATAAPSTSKEQFQLMLRNLLADRLHVKLHRDSRDFIAGYNLVVASGGPKLLPTLDPAPDDVQISPPTAPGLTAILTFEGYVMYSDPQNNASKTPRSSVSTLASVAASVLGKPVADQTGLTGKFDINYADFLAIDRVAPLSFGANKISLEGKLAPLQKKLQTLGLTLEEQHTALDVLVIDSVDSVPPGDAVPAAN